MQRAGGLAGNFLARTGSAHGLRRRWRWAAGLLVLAAVGAALIPAGLVPVLSGRRQATVAIPYPHDLGQVSFAVAGDVIPHEPVRAAAKAEGGGEPGWAALFADVADVFEGADFGFVNLETPVAPEHSKGTKAFLFDGPVELPQALKASGIKIISFANNHVMDQGGRVCGEPRAPERRGAAVCGNERQRGNGVAAGDYRG